ncbi:rhodanese-like domain-containing protein, partial [Aduncisulcus paluster]
MNKKILSFVALSLVLSLSAGCSAGTAGSVGTAKDGNEVKIEAAAMKLVNAVEQNGYELVGTDELNSWIEAGEDMVVIDTMPADFFAKGHVPSAVNA